MKRRAQNLSQVATNLYRSDASGRYYGIFKIGGKQIRRSLKTDDPDLVRHRVDDLRPKVTDLSVEDGRKLRFAEYDERGELIGGLAKKRIDLRGTSLEPSTRDGGAVFCHCQSSTIVSE